MLQFVLDQPVTYLLKIKVSLKVFLNNVQNDKDTVECSCKSVFYRVCQVLPLMVENSLELMVLVP